MATKDMPDDGTTNPTSIKYLALGDSYTVGASVAPVDNFPSQLSRSLEKELDLSVELSILATSGWRTDNLLNALENTAANPSYELVTL